LTGFSVANETRPSVAGTMTLGGKDADGCETSWTTLENYEYDGREQILNWNVGLLK
jgi:hypothetical protein